MLSWALLWQWTPEPLFALMDECTARRRVALDLVDALFIARHQFQAEGRTADAIRSAIGHEITRIERLVDDYSAFMMAAAAAGDGVARVGVMIEECSEEAKGKQLHIDADGTVTGMPGPHGEKNSDAVILEAKIADVLRYAQGVDTAYLDELSKISAGQSHSGEGHGDASQGLPDLPQPDWSPHENAVWWNALTPQERQALIEQHPELIGSTDGIDAVSRDQANRIYLDQLIAASQSELLELIQNPSEENQRRLEDAVARDNELRAIRSAAGQDDAQILLIDRSQPHTRVAIAVGNVDTADYVASYIPGTGTSVVDSLGGSVGHSAYMREVVKRQQSIPEDRVAVISWLGYEAPENVPHPGSAGALVGEHVQGAAADFRDFQEGIHFSRQESGASDPYMTAFGHSYGSPVMGVAADQIAPGVLDDVTYLGAPGAGVQGADELNIDGTAHVSAFERGDGFTGAGFDAALGADPAETEGFVHISNEGLPNPNPGFYGTHSDYYKPMPDGGPNPVQIDMSDIIADGKEDPGE